MLKIIKMVVTRSIFSVYQAYQARSLLKIKNLRLLPVAVFMIFLNPAWAVFVDSEGNRLADTESRKSIGEFGGQLVITEEENVALQNWRTQSEGTNFAEIDAIAKGKTATALVVFKGCSTTDEGLCQLTNQFTVMQPDGEVYAELPTDEMWFEKPPPAKGTLGLSVGYVQLVIEEEDQLGDYQFIVTVIDHVSGAELKLINSIEAVE